MQEIDNIAHKLISAKKAPKSSAFHDTTKGIRTMELVENMHDHYLPPIANKIEWLNMPKLKNEKISIPDIKKFAIAKQDTKDSCGLCSGKMVINTILHKRGDVKNISEKDISEKILLSQLKIIKDYVGITPGHLKASLQELLTQYHLSYTAIEKQFTSYEELKNFLKA